MVETPGQPPKRQAIRIESQVVNPYEESLPQVGEKIGPNRIEQMVGEGATANVYKTWHEGLEVVRAVKVLKSPGNKEARERFLTEAKILADIHHPNILEIYNIGYYNQQVPFIETEYVDGISVKKLIAQNHRVALPAALSIAYFVCQALQYAHTKDYTLYGNVYRGLVHRDIKPDNIVISNDGLVKLMDFGIARPSEVSLHTVGAKIMGTLVYLSPEQLSGTSLDHRSDIFALGAVLYEMITGVRAYPQKTLSELVQKKTKGEYVPVSAHGVDVPRAVADAVHRSMALNPHDRYGTAADLGYDLFLVFREISDRAPPDVLARYVKDPSSVSVVMPAQRRWVERAALPWLIAALATAALAVVALGAALLLK